MLANDCDLRRKLLVAKSIIKSLQAVRGAEELRPTIVSLHLVFERIVWVSIVTAVIRVGDQTTVNVVVDLIMFRVVRPPAVLVDDAGVDGQLLHKHTFSVRGS